MTLQAQYTLDRFGKVPGTVPSILVFIYLRADHLDLDFYNHHLKPGAYLKTHARHMERWHPTKKKSTKDMKTFKRMKRGGVKKREGKK